MKKSLYIVVAASLLALLVMPIAFAGAADGPQATSSANGTAALKKQLKGLKQRIAALEAKETPVFPKALPPNGPAGGDLTGTYPNPTLRPGSVKSTFLANNAVTNSKIDEGAVSTDKIATAAVQAPNMGGDAVGASALKGVTAVVGTGVAVSAGQTKTATVTCPGTTMLIAGGYAWLDKEANSIIASAPDEGNPNQKWVVEGQVDAGSNTLFAWATCIAV